jgi:hypothetical protein
MTLEDNPEDGRSALWIDIAPMVSLAAGSLDSFRSASGVNSRLAHWAPAEPTLRWFKSFVQLAASTAPLREIEILQTVGDTSLGGPVTATVECPQQKDAPDKTPPPKALPHCGSGLSIRGRRNGIYRNGAGTGVNQNGCRIRCRLWTDRAHATADISNNYPVRNC